MKKNNLRKIRKSLSLTLTELSKKTSVSTVSLSYYENGKKLPTLRNCFKIITALNEEALEILDNTAPILTYNQYVVEDIWPHSYEAEYRKNLARRELIKMDLFH